MTRIASQIAFVSRFGAIIFILGKILRFAFFLLFLLLLISKTKVIVGYEIWQVILFFATFNLIDTVVQFFLREVYRFRSYVVSGDFDYFLIKPISPLFRSLFGGSDVLDISMLLISVGFVIMSIFKIGDISLSGVLVYLLLILNAFLIALTFHIFILVVGILTTEVDNTLWLYRDITQMGRLPIDIYKEPIRGILTFILPVGIMMTFPPKSLMGLLSIQSVMIALVVSTVLLYVSLKCWKFAISRYASASS
ncbi:MAG: ABC-2 family transporter protein [Patescibacteria group bacterium]